MIDVKKIVGDIKNESAPDPEVEPDADESYESTEKEGSADHVREVFDALKSDNFEAFKAAFAACLASR